MTEKKLSELLNKELDLLVDEKVPQKVLDTPINKPQKIKTVFTIRKKAIAAISAIACVLIVVICALLIIPNTMKPTDDENNYTCYVIDVNPSVLITADKEGNIISTSAINEDGNLILTDESVKSAKDVESCIQNVIDVCAKLGYIDVNSNENAVKISVKAEVDSLSNEYAKKASSYAQEYLMEKGIFAIVIENKMSLEEFKQKTNLDLSENAVDILKAVQNYTYEKEDISKQFEEYKANAIKQILLDIKTKIDFIYENENNIEKKDEVENAQKYLKETYYLNVENNAFVYKLAFSNIDVEDIKTSQEIIDLIKKSNPYLGAFADLLFEKVPDSEENYLETLKASLTSLYNEKLEIYKSEYEKQRQSISKDSYQEYINAIIEKYGSIESYYEEILKK